MKSIYSAEQSSHGRETGPNRVSWWLIPATLTAGTLFYIGLAWSSMFRSPYLLATLSLCAATAVWIAGSFYKRHHIPLSPQPPERRPGAAVSTTIAAHTHDDTARISTDIPTALDTRSDASPHASPHQRAYALMNAINNAIRRLHDRDAVCMEICRLAIQHGGFHFAWMGWYEPGLTTLQLCGHAGGSDIPTALRAAIAHGTFPSPATMAAGELETCNDLFSDTTLADIHDGAAGARSYTILPLKVGNDITAVLALYADTVDFFTTEEITVMQDVALDVALCLDYVEKKETLHQLSYYDALTALPNRVLFTDRLDQALAREHYTTRHVALVTGHVDRFKEINSTFGPDAGDIVLQEIARRLTHLIRPGDTIARTGGAGFGIILTDVAQPGDAALVANKIAHAMATPIALDGRDILVTLAMGIAVSPEDGQDTEKLVANAMTAEHMLDDEPGTRYRFYTPEIDALVRERYTIERELYHAIERNEFTLEYQPIIHLPTLQIIGSEALLRWRSPRLGAIAPSKFIPIAEKSRLIVPIGEWVLKTASRQVVRWKELGLPSHVSVNASAIQLKERGFEDRARSILADLGEKHDGISMTLEITETNLMENPERAATQLHRLRSRGLSISIDDFGTGYSSLSYLKRLPVDSVKIDISFVRDLTDDPDSTAIVRAIVALAHGLELAVIAEGVETEEQLRILRDAGCDAAQGFLFSPAVAPEAFEALCRSRSVFHGHTATPR